jgi:hypothetical protein
MPDKVSAIVDYPVLDFSDQQEGALLSIITDASGFALGAVVQQRVNEAWKPLDFYRHKLSQAAQKYSSYGRELLAIYASIRKFRYMVKSHDFTVFNDSNNLRII